jgi:hypothetical protein
MSDGLERPGEDDVEDGRALELETKRAMFRAVLAAQCAGEPVVTGRRIVAALLRTESIAAFCSRARIDSARVRDAVDDPATLAFDECERRMEAELAEKGLAFGSKEHQASVQRRPGDPRLKAVFDNIVERHGRLAVAPLELLFALMRADPVLARLLAPHGIDIGER